MSAVLLALSFLLLEYGVFAVYGLRAALGAAIGEHLLHDRIERLRQGRQARDFLFFNRHFLLLSMQRAGAGADDADENGRDQ